MAELSEREIAILNREIRKQGLTYTQLQKELLDHLCSDIEAKMEEGLLLHLRPVLFLRLACLSRCWSPTR